MFEVWFSIGYILLLVVLLFVFILWRLDSRVLAVVALIAGVALLFWWEYARPTWTQGIVSGTEVRRSDPDAKGQTYDVQLIYMRNRADAGVELQNDDSWWWFKRNSERVFNDAKTAEARQTEVIAMWYGWRSQLFSWNPNVLALRSVGNWPYWSWRTIGFYGFSLVLWIGYFYAFIWMYRRSR